MTTVQLTQRELTILEYCGKGLQFKDIADRLNCKPSAVRSGVREIYNKLGATNRYEAVELGREKGFIREMQIDGIKV